MTNEQFRDYLQQKKDALYKMVLQDRPDNWAEQEQMLTSAIRIMTYGTGPERRRFRRDYERRLRR